MIEKTDKTSKEMIPKKIIVEGGKGLFGTVKISGSKHSVLHVLGAVPLIKGEVKLSNYPDLSDSNSIVKIYSRCGIRAEYNSSKEKMTFSLEDKIKTPELIESSDSLKSSWLLLGGLLMRSENKKISLAKPKGDIFGCQDSKAYLSILRKFGIKCRIRKRKYTDIIDAEYDSYPEKKMQIDMNKYYYDNQGIFKTRNNATALVYILAAANKGSCTIKNSVYLSELSILKNFISKIPGVRLYSPKNNKKTLIIESEGIEEIINSGSHSIDFSIDFDKCELGFMAVASALTRGEIVCDLDGKIGSLSMLEKFKSFLEKIGIESTLYENSIVFNGRKYKQKPIDLKVEQNAEYGLGLDIFPQFISLMGLAKGKSNYCDDKYGQDRFKNFIKEFQKIGGEASLIKNGLKINGINKYNATGKEVSGKDIRSAATLLLCLLATRGKNNLSGADRLFRGYSNLIDKLNSLGAEVSYGL